ncbi:MAG: siroheme synthase CysG [Antarcticimicrobium sp.]|uniref:siroheme synthase CysG n=1 Tax=Antarcticimicrobium sp. TaxID=2824147 RepID=UPI002620F2EA|nr:siroheme synthase CysG [Antarcticimicrobium sp.]MDF1717918.1 siroheme synthase CysG [Antarcticimicrobium sp.]
MEYLPIFLDVRDHLVLVDGGGTAAARRAERALSAGARVLVLDPAPGDELQRLTAEAPSGLSFEARLPGRDDVVGARVVYGASDDAAREARLLGWARDCKVLCDISDATDRCDFITPSIVDRSPVVVAISTGGAAPVVARTLRARIETMLSPAYGQLTAFVSRFRDRIAAGIGDARTRRHFWDRMIDGPVGDLYLSGNEAGAIARFEADLACTRAGKEAPMGEVYLVGAGPGDPDLLTFRALRLMQRADVVLYDRLVDPEMLSLVRRDAERIYVGKLPKEHTMEQGDISALLVKLALQGKRVLRLKGGDPFIFGRGGEEIEQLAARGIPFRVVPGITAAAGCAAYAGIPLTHRDHAQSCLFVTAHGRDGVLELDWEVLIRPAQTVAVYMGLQNLPALVEGFARRGISMQADVALVENGTRADQRVLTGTLGDIVDQARAAGFKSPTMIIIGSVVQLRARLAPGNAAKDIPHSLSISATQD